MAIASSFLICGVRARSGVDRGDAAPRGRSAESQRWHVRDDDLRQSTTAARCFAATRGQHSHRAGRASRCCWRRWGCTRSLRIRSASGRTRSASAWRWARKPADVLGMVVRTGMLLTAAGLAAGLLAPWRRHRLVAGMLIGVSAHPPAHRAWGFLPLPPPSSLASAVGRRWW